MEIIKSVKFTTNYFNFDYTFRVELSSEDSNNNISKLYIIYDKIEVLFKSDEVFLNSFKNNEKEMLYYFEELDVLITKHFKEDKLNIVELLICSVEDYKNLLNALKHDYKMFKVSNFEEAGLIMLEKNEIKLPYIEFDNKDLERYFKFDYESYFLDNIGDNNFEYFLNNTYFYAKLD